MRLAFAVSHDRVRIVPETTVSVEKARLELGFGSSLEVGILTPLFDPLPVF
jgi:hypothetical protein